MREPWLVQSDEVYKEKGGWEAYADYESWLLDQMSEANQEAYQEVHPQLQTQLYVIFNNFFDLLAPQTEVNSDNEKS